MRGSGNSNKKTNQKRCSKFELILPSERSPDTAPCKPSYPQIRPHGFADPCWLEICQKQEFLHSGKKMMESNRMSVRFGCNPFVITNFLISNCNLITYFFSEAGTDYSYIDFQLCATRYSPTLCIMWHVAATKNWPDCKTAWYLVFIFYFINVLATVWNGPDISRYRMCQAVTLLPVM